MNWPDDYIGKIIQGDALAVLKTLPEGSIDCCITSPPYWGLRDYGNDGQLGLEKTPEEYVANLVNVFREVKRVLKKDGTFWLNLGDSYAMRSMRGENSEFKETSIGKTHNDRYKDGAMKLGKRDIPIGLKPKDLVGIPWRVAFALQADGWYLRQDIIWHKPNPMPESVTDRCTKAHEYIFLLAKSPKYYFDNEAIKEKAEHPESIHVHKEGNKMSEVSEDVKFATKPQRTMGGYTTRNKRSVWTITTKPFREAHFATFPEDLITPMVLAGCPKGGVILDPFMGAGTSGLVAKKLGRNYIGIELNPEYIMIAKKRIAKISEPLF